MFRLLEVGLHTGIFEYLSRAEIGYHWKEIQKKFQSFETERLYRFLNASVSGGLLKYDEEGRYSVDEQDKKFYDSISEQYVGAFINHMDIQTRDQLKDLEEIICGMPSKNQIFSKLYRDRESVRKFLDAMWGLGYSEARTIIQNKEFPKYKKLADIGGGTGAFSIVSILEEKVEEAVVFDLHDIEFYVNEKIEMYQLTTKLAFVGGNFFKDELPVVDAYVLGYILSDWTDDVCRELIRKIYDVSPKGADIIILEKLFNKNKLEPFSTAMMDICMMVETGGKHRTYDEYKALLEECGFSNVHLIKSTGEKHAIIGKKE